MAIYRIFTNDRRSKNGVAMYSCFKEIRASSPLEALKRVPPEFDAPSCAEAIAIQWPESAQSDDEKVWLRKHVGPVTRETQTGS